ncbi:MAG: hypothetical protein JW783_02020 [Bacteroidales bacterium]|nr:hypothetical protein [Bacteroidales bacterium]MBN2749491.1 hypothetical protein [Bacteroidales bacterium]
MALQNRVLLGFTILSLTLVSWGNSWASAKNSMEKKDKKENVKPTNTKKDTLQTDKLPSSTDFAIKKIATPHNKRGKQESTNKSSVVIENSESLTEWEIMFVYDDGLCKEKSTMNQVRCKGKKRGIREVIARIF